MQKEEKHHVMVENKGMDVKGKSKYLVVGGGGCFIVLCVDQLVVAFFRVLPVHVVNCARCGVITL